MISASTDYRSCAGHLTSAEADKGFTELFAAAAQTFVSFLCSLARRQPDAWAAQHAIPQSKPIALFFALVALYLHVQRQLAGRQVWRVHMNLAQQTEPWPVGMLPVARGAP